MFSKAYLHSHIFVPLSEIRDLEQEKLKLTITSRFSPEVQIPIYRIVEPYFGYPRHWWNGSGINARHVEDLTEVGKRIQIKMRSELYPKQKIVDDKFRQSIATGKTGFILNAAPGWGKTRVLIGFLSYVGRTALVVVPKSDLINQWVDRFIEHTNLKREDIGTVEGRNADWKGKKVVIALVHSLGLGYLGKDFRDSFGVVVYDEVHSSCPPATFSPISCMFPARIRIGASATLKRTDGLHVVFEKHLGEVLLEGEDTNRMPPKVVLWDFSDTSGHIWAVGDLQCRGQIISRVASNKSRTERISEWALRLLQDGRRVVVISDRTEQLYWISEELKRLGVLANKIGFYCRSLSMPGGGSRTITKAELKATADNCDILLATYGLMAQGTDIPELSGMVMATPRADIIQMKGRIERFLEGKKSPILIDIVDSAYNECVQWSKKRIRIYKKEGLDIQWQ